MTETKDWISKMTQFSRDLELKDQELSYETIDISIREYLDEEYKELDSASALQNDKEILDGAGDVAFIALNIIYKLGRLKGKSHEEATNLVREVMNRICDSNLTKLLPDGSVLRDEDTGKILKPGTFDPVNLGGLV